LNESAAMPHCCVALRHFSLCAKVVTGGIPGAGGEHGKGRTKSGGVDFFDFFSKKIFLVVHFQHILLSQLRQICADVMVFAENNQILG
jgi:hypothetical protein